MIHYNSPRSIALFSFLFRSTVLVRVGLGEHVVFIAEYYLIEVRGNDFVVLTRLDDYCY